MKHVTILSASVILALSNVAVATAQDGSMSFFVTSEGSGDGANLGGLEGADAHCSSLAEAAGVTGKTWAAYLSTSDTNARDRIGAGPWVNAKGETIAESLDALHSEQNRISKETALDEHGEMVNGRGDDPNRHDILTGSMPDGTVHEATCEDWTSNADDGSAMVGHHDRMGLDESAEAKSWNSSHPSRGCSQTALQGTGGDGLFYCFALQ
ncbi:hypothetical protein [Chelativorans salis]|uniref:Lectin n=1 Tax=Chelativorans salis TaxID=2978478 RepID=A0ABT2LTP1_9HYPH|nr:hypothetical protein [Chelativorans sp. EGI FJ00035]MCT7377902.1 hypothetical protein [Chelativorans sp. EGI FJ00035]